MKMAGKARQVGRRLPRLRIWRRHCGVNHVIRMNRFCRVRAQPSGEREVEESSLPSDVLILELIWILIQVLLKIPKKKKKTIVKVRRAPVAACKNRKYK